MVFSESNLIVHLELKHDISFHSDDSKDQTIETQPPKAEKAKVESPVLDIHVKQKHEKKEPFQCEICNISFSLKYNLVKHIESVHVENVPLLEDGENTVGPTGAVHDEKNSLNEIENDQTSDLNDTKNSNEFRKLHVNPSAPLSVHVYQAKKEVIKY